MVKWNLATPLMIIDTTTNDLQLQSDELSKLQYNFI